MKERLPNFVSGQWSTCDLDTMESGDSRWCYSLVRSHVVSAGMPAGSSPQSALLEFDHWCREHSYRPLIFGCEEKDLDTLKNWSVTEIGRQPIFEASPEFAHHLSGKNQPESHRKLRRQARRSASKGVVFEELNVATLWRLSQQGRFDPMLFQRWNRRGLADFTFLVDFRINGGEGRRSFLGYSQYTGEALILAFLVPSDRGWLLEHQLVSPLAPNGTAELLLCHLLAQFLRPGELLSLGITPLYSELSGLEGEHSVLSMIPARIRAPILAGWEPLYGFRSLYDFRRKLEPDRWEKVYWAVPHRRPVSDTLAVLRAFAGGPLWNFFLKSVTKRGQRWASSIKRARLLQINSFYITSLFFWIPILWNIDGRPIFGSTQACQVWAIYDIFLLLIFALHHRVVKRKKVSPVTDILLGLVTADMVLSWTQSLVFHQGLPASPLLALFVFLLNTAPFSALLFLLIVRFANQPVPFCRREQPLTS